MAAAKGSVPPCLLTLTWLTPGRLISAGILGGGNVRVLAIQDMQTGVQRDGLATCPSDR